VQALSKVGLFAPILIVCAGAAIAPTAQDWFTLRRQPQFVDARRHLPAADPSGPKRRYLPEQPSATELVVRSGVERMPRVVRLEQVSGNSATGASVKASGSGKLSAEPPHQAGPVSNETAEKRSDVRVSHIIDTKAQRDASAGPALRITGDRKSIGQPEDIGQVFAPIGNSRDAAIAFARNFATKNSVVANSGITPSRPAPDGPAASASVPSPSAAYADAIAFARNKAEVDRNVRCLAAGNPSARSC
jgi:hypothetical protein